MTDILSTSGLVATVPRHLVTDEGLPITSFRLAATQRRFNRSTQSWENGETNWFTVTAFRQLAINLAGSIEKGERVLVSGRLRVREWENGDRTGTVVELDADAVGHDLNWGSTSFRRTVRPESGNQSSDSAAAGSTSGTGDYEFAPETRGSSATEWESIDSKASA